MTNENQTDPGSAVPHLISNLLERYPILPGEDRRELKAIFRSLAFRADEVAEKCSDYMIVYRTSVLVYETQRLELMRANVIRHHYHAAVGALLLRTFKPGCEPGSIADLEYGQMVLDYFKGDAEKHAITDKLVAAGYAPDAVEVEAFLQAEPHLVVIDRQIGNLNRQLLQNFKELDRRYARRAAEAIKKEAKAIIARAGKKTA